MAAKKDSILIIDDNPANLSVMMDYLTRQDFEILAAEDGESALELLHYTKPDLILLDVMMPGIDGFETCRRLKANPTTREIPVIFMTALSDTENKIHGFEVGSVDYLTKPIQNQELLARVNMHISMRNLQQHLRERNSQLEREIFERKHVETALRYYTEDLEASNAELDAFAHTVAHDLKTPLALVIGYSEFLIEFLDEMSLQEIRKHIQLVILGGHRMTNIIDELLLLASVRKTQEIQTSSLNMKAIIAEVLDRLRINIEETHAEIALPQTWPTAIGYAPWIEEVWANYVSNAIKYGGVPPQIELGGSLQPDGKVRFWVRDNGKGVTEKEKTQLFIEFTRLRKIQAEGYGLGLSIVRRILEKLNGEVGVESEPQEGSTFYFTLPTHPQA